MRPAIYKHKYRRFFPFKRSLKRLSNKFLPKLNNFKRLRQFRKVKFLNKRNYFLFFKKNLTNILFTELLLCRHVFSFFTFKHYLSFTSQYYSDTFLHQNAVFDQFFITSPSIYLFTRGVVSRDTGSILLTNTIQKQNSTFSLLKSKQLAPNFNQWYALKKRLSNKIIRNRHLILTVVTGSSLLETNTFYPHFDNVKIFKNFISSNFLIEFSRIYTTYVFYASLMRLLSSTSLKKSHFLPKIKFFSPQILNTLVLQKNYIPIRHFRRFFFKKIKKYRHVWVFWRKWKRRYRFFYKRFRVRKRQVLRISRKLFRKPRKLKKCPSISFLENYKYNFFNKLKPLTFSFRRSNLFLFHNKTYQVKLGDPQNFRVSPNFSPNLFTIKGCTMSPIITPKPIALMYFFINPFYLKLLWFGSTIFSIHNVFYKSHDFSRLFNLPSSTNLLPNFYFQKIFTKKILTNRLSSFLRSNIVPWAYNNLIRFLENCSGKKVLVQIYSYITQNVAQEFFTVYLRWAPRMHYYERRLGHRFFLGEALSLIHLSFSMHDAKLFLSWLKAIIKRISFWKTRLIFRFIKYLMSNFFRYIFAYLNVRGLKLKLKGKISVSGNSRKRSILYRVGSTSHSTVNLKVLHEFDTICTFTGVMGFQVWIFY